MKRPPVSALALVAVAALFLASSVLSHRSNKRPRAAPTPTIHKSSASHVITRGMDGLLESVMPDTTLLGFWDFDGGGGACDAQGWVSLDPRDDYDLYFHVDDFAGLGGGDFGRLVPIEGSQSLWCGTRGDASSFYCGWATLPGYGDLWDQLFLTADCLDVTGDVTIDFLQTYDIDEDYDFLYLQYDTCDGNWNTIATFTGIDSGYYSYTVPASQHNGSIRFRFYFFSDWDWSDRDGLWNSDGATIIDSLTVTDNLGIVLPTELFEVEAVGATVTVSGNWMADELPGFGDYAALYPGNSLVQEDPGVYNTTCMWAFINGSPDNYACGGFPNQAVVPYGDGFVGKEFIENEIWSPPIPYVGSGSDVALSFDVYRDLPLDPLVFYVWSVRSWIDGCPGLWKDRNLVYYDEDKLWFEHVEPIGDLIEPGAEYIQIALGVEDHCWNWCAWLGTGQCHSHAPLFDNVRVYRIATATGISDGGPAFRNTLSQNHPNPFNPTTTITYSIRERARVSLKIYDVSGRLVRTLVDEVKDPGPIHEVTWDGRNDRRRPVASGVYVCRLVTEHFTQTRKLVLLK